MLDSLFGIRKDGSIHKQIFKKEGTIIKRILAITSFVLLFVVLIAISKAFTPNDTAKEVELVPEITHVSKLQQAENAWKAAPTLNTLLAYGTAMDTTMLAMDSVRAELQKQFFEELAKEAGSRYDINWNILYGLWMRESAVNPNAKGDGKFDSNGKLIPNSYRAFGLGQVHLRTAKTHYDAEITEVRLMNPIENGMASAKVLRDYSDIFKGNIRYGISAYQQGPEPTRKQLTQKTQLKNIDYVLDVLQNAAEVH